MLRRPIVLAALATALAAPASAHADAFDDVFADYQQDGRIAACKFSPEVLESAQGQVPGDIEQYAPEFPGELEEALENRARADCPAGSGAQDDAAGTGGTAGTATTPAAPGDAAPTQAPDPAAAAAAPPGGTPAPPGTASPAPPAADGAIVRAASRTPERGADEAPAPLLVLAVLGALLLLGLLLWSLMRFFAWEPRWLAGARHATAEAGWRSSAVWEDFTDWLRRGRAPSSR